MSQMNVTVLLQLIDQLSGPAKAAAQSLKALNQGTGTKGARGVKQYTRGQKRLGDTLRKQERVVARLSRAHGELADFTSSSPAVRRLRSKLRLEQQAIRQQRRQTQGVQRALQAQRRLAAVHEKTGLGFDPAAVRNLRSRLRVQAMETRQRRADASAARKQADAQARAAKKVATAQAAAARKQAAAAARVQKQAAASSSPSSLRGRLRQSQFAALTGAMASPLASRPKAAKPTNLKKQLRAQQQAALMSGAASRMSSRPKAVPPVTPATLRRSLRSQQQAALLSGAASKLSSRPRAPAGGGSGKGSGGGRGGGGALAGGLAARLLHGRRRGGGHGHGLIGFKQGMDAGYVGLHGYGRAALGVGAIMAGIHAAKEGMEYGHEQAAMGAAGMTNDEISAARATAHATSQSVRTTSPAANMRAIRELRQVFGSEEHAQAHVAQLQRASAVLGAMVPKLNPEDETFALAKANELTGRANTPEAFNARLESMVKAINASGGRVTGRDYFQFAKYLRGGGVDMGNRFWGEIAPTLIQELGGSSAGTALASLRQAIVGNKMTQKSAEAFRSLGMVDMSRAPLDKKGLIAPNRMQPGAIRGAQKFAEDPYAFVVEDLATALQRHGMHPGSAQANALIDTLFGNRNAAQAVKLLLQKQRLEKDAELNRKAKGVSAYDDMVKSDPKMAMRVLASQWNGFLQSLSSGNMSGLTRTMNELSNILARMSRANLDDKSLGMLDRLWTTLDGLKAGGAGEGIDRLVKALQGAQEIDQKLRQAMGDAEGPAGDEAGRSFADAKRRAQDWKEALSAIADVIKFFQSVDNATSVTGRGLGADLAELYKRARSGQANQEYDLQPTGPDGQMQLVPKKKPGSDANGQTTPYSGRGDQSRTDFDDVFDRARRSSEETLKKQVAARRQQAFAAERIAGHARRQGRTLQSEESFLDSTRRDPVTDGHLLPFTTSPPTKHAPVRNQKVRRVSPGPDQVLGLGRGVMDSTPMYRQNPALGLPYPHTPAKSADHINNLLRPSQSYDGSGGTVGGPKLDVEGFKAQAQEIRAEAESTKSAVVAVFQGADLSGAGRQMMASLAAGIRAGAPAAIQAASSAAAAVKSAAGGSGAVRQASRRSHSDGSVGSHA